VFRSIERAGDVRPWFVEPLDPSASARSVVCTAAGEIGNLVRIRRVVVFEERVVIRMVSRIRNAAWIAAFLAATTSCTEGSPTSDTPSPSGGSRIEASPEASPIDSRVPVLIGEPIDTESLIGRIVLSNEDDVYTLNADGTGLVQVTDRRGPEFDPTWSPDGSRIVYRDSRRGINRDDEIFVMDADGGHPTNLTRDPANDWGPDWSPVGRTIVFNSDRDGFTMGGFLIDADGSNLRRIPTDAYVEYPSWSPDGERIAFMGGDDATEYDIWVVDVDGRDLVRLTDSYGPDGWPAWSPDGKQIAFTSVRDDCSYSEAADCRTTGDIGPHHDVWIVNADGSGLRRVTSEFGQFVTWSPDGRYLLVAGYDLFVIRPDGTGRASLDIDGLRGGLFPDWIR
jgi:Tol biopolymer transport system component